MKVRKQIVELLNPEEIAGMNKRIEIAGRTCYKSEDKITDSSADDFVKGIILRGHEAMIEHGGVFQFRITTDIGVTHELVRHRIASYAQESTRYCDYVKSKFGSELTFILPTFLYPLYDKNGEDGIKNTVWYRACKASEEFYNEMSEYKYIAQEKSTVLNKSLKTEIVVTMNPREFRSFLMLRLEHFAKPQMQDIARQMFNQAYEYNKVILEDVKAKRTLDMACDIYQRNDGIVNDWNRLKLNRKING